MSRRWIVWIAAVAAFAALGFLSRPWVTAAIARTEINANRAKFVSSPDSPAKNLVATLWVDSVRIYEDHQIRVDLTLDNHSDRDAQDLSIAVQAPGFDPVSQCWKEGHPACDDAGGLIEKLPPVPAGESLHLHGSLKPSHSGRFGLLAIYHWTEITSAAAGAPKRPRRGAPSAPGKQTFTRAVTLEPVEVTTRLHERASAFASFVTLPVSLAILGGLWAWLNKHRDDVRAAQDKERERDFEVWKEQLGRLFEYTQQHYLNISRSILGTATETAKAAAAPPRKNRIFFHLVMLWLYLRDLRDRRGGWFFSDKGGEEVLFAGWGLAMNQIDAKLDTARLDLLVEAIKKPVSFGKFRGYFAQTHPLHTMFTDAEKQCLDWVDGAQPLTDAGDSFRRCLAVLNLMRLVMRFEWDRPFVGYWYRKAPEFDFAKFRDLLTQLPLETSLDVDGKRYLKGLAEKSKTYVDSVEEQLGAAMT